MDDTYATFGRLIEDNKKLSQTNKELYDNCVALAKYIKTVEDELKAITALYNEAESLVAANADNKSVKHEEMPRDLDGKFDYFVTAVEDYLDEAKTEAGKFICNADEEAKEIVENATAEAKDIIDNADIKAKEIIDNANAEAKGIIDNADTQARGIIENADSLARETIGSANSEANEIVGNAGNEAKSIIERVNIEQSKASETKAVIAEEKPAEPVAVEEPHATDTAPKPVSSSRSKETEDIQRRIDETCARINDILGMSQLK